MKVVLISKFRIFFGYLKKQTESDSVYRINNGKYLEIPI